MSKFVEEIPYDLKYEKLDRTPLEIPIDCKLPETTEQIVARIMANSALANSYKSGDVETLDEFDDFDMDDEEPDFVSPYEDEKFEGYTDDGFKKGDASQSQNQPEPQGSGSGEAANSGQEPAADDIKE